MEDMEFIRIPLHGGRGEGKFILVDGDYDGEYFSQYKWYLSGENGYPYRRDWREGKNVYLHQEVCHAPKGMFVDHINRDKLDNRGCNLRCVTPQQNVYNRSQRKTSKKGGFRGVHQSMTQEKGGKIYYAKSWVAYCKGRYLGSFATEKEAALAYNKAAIESFGGYAVLNLV